MYLIGQLSAKELLNAQQTCKNKKENTVQCFLGRLVCLPTGQAAHGEAVG